MHKYSPSIFSMNFDVAYGQNVGSALIDHKIVCAIFAKPLNSSTQKKKKRNVLIFIPDFAFEKIFYPSCISH